MGRASRSRALSVWSNGLRVGTWRLPIRGDMELQYDETWRDSPGGRPLSLSLPLGEGRAPLRGAAVQNYFDNLLPDSAEIRKRLAGRFKVSAEPFDLLGAIGRDCVGAVQLLPEDGHPDRLETIDGTPLSEDEIARHLQGVAAPAAMGQADDDNFRISIAGAQEKTALLWSDGQWMLPQGATPTTHILKLPLGLVGNMKADLRTSVENEWLCMRLLKAFGLPVANAVIRDFADQRVLCVERFDRQLHSSGRWIMRLPQEDFCQVHGLPPDMKYESDGGPGPAKLAAILANSERGRADIETLLAAQVLFWMMAAVDGHAKNFSIQLLPQGRYRLTPLYDVMSAWPIIGEGANLWSWHKTRMAMAVSGKNRHYLLKDIQRRHFNATAAQCGYGKDCEALIQHILSRVPRALDEVAAELPAGFPQRVADSIFTGVRESAERMEQMPAG